MWHVVKFSGGRCSGSEGQVEVVVGVDGKGEIECRICQEDREEDAMDSPCAKTGTLKVNFLSLPCPLPPSGRMFLF
jgi:hypothetical protein